MKVQYKIILFIFILVVDVVYGVTFTFFISETKNYDPLRIFTLGYMGLFLLLSFPTLAYLRLGIKALKGTLADLKKDQTTLLNCSIFTGILLSGYLIFITMRFIAKNGVEQYLSNFSTNGWIYATKYTFILIGIWIIFDALSTRKLLESTDQEDLRSTIDAFGNPPEDENFE